MTRTTFVSFSQWSRLKSGPNKRGWKVASDPRDQRCDFSTWARLFSAEFPLGGFPSTRSSNCRQRLFPQDLAKLACQKKKHGLNKINAHFWSCCESPVIVIRDDKSLLVKAFGLNVRSLLRPSLSLRRSAGSAPTAHIPSDHSCVWHFKEDYGNEMW